MITNLRYYAGVLVIAVGRLLLPREGRRTFDRTIGLVAADMDKQLEEVRADVLTKVGPARTHNPWSFSCGKRIHSEPFTDDARCEICEGVRP